MERQPARSELVTSGVENIRFDAVTATEIISWSEEQQQRLKLELEKLFRESYPRMPAAELEEWVEDYFRAPMESSQRHALLLWNEADGLFAATLFDQAEIEYCGRFFKGIYIIDRTVSTRYQRLGIGRRMATSILSQFQPEILMTTCTQPAPLYSWIALVRQTFPGEFEVFPRFENEMPLPFPSKELDFALRAFRQLYSSVVNGDRVRVERAVAELTVLLVRKNMYLERYDFSPWEKAGKSDPLARALGVGPRDGILLVLLRRGMIKS
jgi:hypothetical protein